MSTNLLSVIEQQQKALEHCVDAIVERGLNGSQEQARKWGLQLPLERAYAALAACQQALEQTQVEAEPEWNDENVIAYCIARGISAAKAFTTGATQPKVEPAPKRCGLCGDCDAKAQKACTVPACFARDDYKPAPSTAGERAQVVEDLLMYAGDNGYSHIDYADTMRHAAALLSAPALPVPSDSDDLIKALADVRDLFPIPERGNKLEHAWMEAVAFPESVPAYVRACIAPAAMPVGELPEPFHPRASHINPDYRDGWNAALAAASSQPVREPLTDYSDTATIAGLESSVGHLSVMVDELRLMLGDAMNAMTELHSKVTPDEDTPNIDGIVPAAAYAKFVNAHADLLYRIHHSPHAGQLSRLPAAHGITKKGGES